MKGILSLAVLSIALTGCSSGDSSNDSDPLLSDISGVWDASRTFGQEVDEYYVIIKESGVTVSYDYDGDSFDQGDNCYYKYSDAISGLGNDDFEIILEDGNIINASMKVSNNDLVVTVNDFTQTWPKSSLQESDFSPLCSDFSASAVQNLAAPVKQRGVIGLIDRH
jgi:hypothetical protein